MAFYLGIDGGGTTTRAVLGSASLDILATGLAPAAQAHRAPLQEVQGVVCSAAETALATAGLSWSDVGGACVGLAGLGRPETRARMQTALAPFFGVRLLLKTDYEVALSGALEDDPGVLVLAGTGTIGVAQTAGGEVLRCGGWGWLLGDEGSGVWIGREAIRAVLWAADGRGPSTCLTDLLMERQGVAQPAALVWHFAGQADPARDLADLVPTVLQAAALGDDVATTLLAEAGRHVGRLALALLRRVPSARQVYYGGGILTHSEQTRQAFCASVLAESGLQSLPATRDGARGALWLAARQFAEK